MTFGKVRPLQQIVLSRDQFRASDAIATERFGIAGVVLMENAGSAAARFIASIADNSEGSVRVCIIAGAGNNAGDGFVVARHLYNEGFPVEVLICVDRSRFRGDALTNLAIIENMKLPIVYPQPEEITESIQKHAAHCDIVVDALLGTGTAGPPRGAIRDAIEAINSLENKTVVALDIPSGLDCDTGEPLEIAVRADYTVTFAAMKKGFMKLKQLPAAAEYIGVVTVAPIGINTAMLIDDGPKQ